MTLRSRLNQAAIVYRNQENYCRISKSWARKNNPENWSTATMRLSAALAVPDIAGFAPNWGQIGDGNLQNIHSPSPQKTHYNLKA